MRNDQIFVLLLVVLLPLSGCFDNAVGEAEADEYDDVEMTHQEQLFSLHLLANDNHTVTVNGTSLKIDSSFHEEAGVFRTEAGAWLRHPRLNRAGRRSLVVVGRRRRWPPCGSAFGGSRRLGCGWRG